MRCILAGIVGLAFLALGLEAAAEKAAISIDKPKLENYIRYAEGFSPSVKMTIDDPAPTPIAGYYRLSVHLSMGEAKQDKTYYLTADGKRIINGPIWDLDSSPFRATEEELPTSGPSFGPKDARITIVEFSDFQCPYCREFARTLRENVPQKYPKDVRVIFEDFPIDSLHPWARAAAEAAHCVGDGNPDLFWSYHDWIFTHQGEINIGNLREKVLSFAKEHQLDQAKLTSCLDTHATKTEVETSIEKGRQLGIEKTPTFYLNGRAVPGALPWSNLDTLIQMELNRPGLTPQAQARK
jgi:protein-disulfide isomerase